MLPLGGRYDLRNSHQGLFEVCSVFFAAANLYLTCFEDDLTE
jgi:hypothetical protein